VPEQEQVHAFDASVVINLLGSGIADRFITALNGKILLVEHVFQEVLSDPGKRRLFGISHGRLKYLLEQQVENVRRGFRERGAL